MIERITATLAMLMICSIAGSGWAQEGPSAAPSITFCEISGPRDTRECEARTVTLPHQWRAATKGYSFGRYRFEFPRPQGGSHALLLDRLTLDGLVLVDGHTVIDKLDPDRVTRQRYWPLMASFTSDQTSAKPLVVEVVVRGHATSKSGLGNLEIGTLEVIDQRYRSALAVEVLLVVALAAASLLAGAVGLLIGESKSHDSRLLIATSWLALVSGLRCLHNLVTEPPISVLLWQQLGLWLLALVGLLGTLVAATSIAGPRNLQRPFGIAAILILALLMLPATWVDPALVVNMIFISIALTATVVIALLIRHVYRKPEPFGLSILAVFGLTLLTGIHDLWVHFGPNSLSGDYVQTWSLPAVIILAVVALARRAATQREVEIALQHATSRREDLLRDLHDRVGSRLVALAFHAQQRSQDPAFVEEIKSLITEVRMIQSAVSTEATTLESLLADLRHLYSRIGGGQLPLLWEIDETAGRIQLTADQALAVVRIVEEAVANAIKHAAPGSIVLRVVTCRSDRTAVLEIVDDGKGEFAPSASGGLANMQARARQAGLDLQFHRQSAASKAVRLVFPRRKSSRKLFTDREAT